MRNGSERIWWGNEARAGPLKVEGCVPARIPMTESAPNKALEPTAPMVALWQAGVVPGAAAHRQR
jgi:hypothetical protein